MKKFLFLFSVLCVLQLKAQESILTVDNQTPGWLSSLMTYSQQVEVEDLTVTGYVNETDMDYLCDLVKRRKLSKLNLYDVNVIPNEGIDNILWEGFLKDTGQRTLSKLVLPVHVIGRFTSDIIQCVVDTVIVSSPNTFLLREWDGTINNVYGYNGSINFFKKAPKYVKLLEGVTMLKTNDLYFDKYSKGNNTPIIILPESLEVIYGNALINCELLYPFNLPANIIRLGTSPSNNNQTHLGSAWISDESYYNKRFPIPVSESRFDFPDNLKAYYGGYQTSNGSSGQSVYHYYKSDTIVIGEKCDTLFAKLDANVAYFKTIIPPVTDIGNSCISSIKLLYVPKGCVEKYKAAYGSSINTIKEIQNVSSILINPSEINLEINEVLQLEAIIQPYDAFDKSLIWTSSDDNIASVDGNGKVTAHQSGIVSISAISRDGGIEGTCQINVLQHATGISVYPSEVLLNNIGSTLQLTANVEPDNSCNKAVEWLSGNMSVCHVSNDGLLTATGYGATVVFATAVDGGFSASCVVNVKELSGITDCSEETINDCNRYSLSGAQLASPVKGLNIIKLSNGTAKIVVVKK